MLKLVPIFLILLSGCSVVSHTVSVQSTVPVLNVPARPTLDTLDANELTAFRALPDTAQKKLVGNDVKLKSYAEQMNVTLEVYNNYAKSHNANANQAVKP